MKNTILLCVVLSLCACVKIQKKSEIEQPQDPTIQLKAETQTEPQPEPVIFVLDEVMSLNQDVLIVADEVHLKSNARIYTNQFALNIQATSIYIDRGVFIQTFPEHNMIASMETNGLNGGAAHIKGNDIHGNLQVFMNGQSGGEGLGGWAALPEDPNPLLSGLARDACFPNSGKNGGISGSFFLEVNESQNFSISTSMKLAEGGPIGPVSKEFFFNVKDYATKYKKTNDWKGCATVPVIGKAGTPGQICLKLTQNDLPKCGSY
jgi:hypothetical protein